MTPTPAPLLYESHLHTPLCRHAQGEPEDYAQVALARNLKGLIVTCHNPLPDGMSPRIRMDPHEFGDYLALVERARVAFADRIEVRLGLEADYLPGLESFLEAQLKSAEFHHVLGSVHPHIREYQARFWTGDFDSFARGYFDHLAQAAETQLFDTLSHPDLVKNSAPEQWQPSRLMPHIQRALDRISAAGTAMELNTSGLLKSFPEMNPGPLILREICARNIPVVLGADAHVPQRVAENYELALDLLKELGFKTVSFFLNRQRQTVSIDDARASLRPLPV